MEDLGQFKANILIVDDDVLIAESTKIQLRKANYHTIGTAFTANEAIQIAKDKNPDLILMDVNLGGNVDGISAAGEIQEFADIPFIFVTAYSDNATIERAKKIGPFGYLIKPYNERELLVAIETSLYKHSFDKKIKEQELLFKTVANFAYEWEYWLLPDLQFKYCSPSCKRVTGYTSEEFISNPKLLIDIVYPDDRKNFEEHIRDYYSERRDVHFQDYEFRIIDKQGNQKFLSHSCRAINDDISNYRGRRVTNVDITERKKSEELLLKLKKAVDTSGETIFLTDSEGIFTYINPAFTTLYGFTTDEVVGKVTPRIIKGGQLDPDVYTWFWKSLKTRNEVKAEFVNKRKNGNLVNIEVSASPILDEENNILGFLGMQHDITERKLSEEALKESEEKYRSLVDNSPEAIAIYVEGKIVYVNNTSVSLMGASTAEDLIGMPVMNFVHPDYREFAVKRIMEAEKSGKLLPLAEEKFFRLDGSEIDVEVKAIPISFNKKPAVQVIVSDITERKRDIDALRESEERFRSLFQNNKAVMLLIDIENDFKIANANEAACKFYGYTKENFLQNIHAYHLNIDSVDKLQQRMGKSLRGEQNYLALKHKLSNGEIRDVEIFISIIFISGKRYIFSIINDITEIKKIQLELEEYKKHLEDLVEERTAELEASKERFRYLSENSKDSILRIDSKFVIHYINESMKNRWDIKVGENLLEVLVINKVSESLRNLIAGALQETFEAKVVVRKQIFHKNEFWMDWVFIPEINPFNEVETILGYGRDITEIKQLQEKIQAAFEKEKELNELKTNFISFASHEFRTPLTTIQTSADLLRLFGRKWSEEKYDKHFTQIETSIDEITHMLEQVLTISRAERGKNVFEPSKANLRFLIDEVIAGINLLPYFNHIISVNYAIEREEFNIDTKLVKSILQNLISNAVKYSPKANRIELEVIQEENSLRFEIEDHGIGIPENEKNKIFEPFHRASNIGTIEGTGLGLAIVKQMVEVHNGTISVQSKINEGTKFSVIINTKT